MDLKTESEYQPGIKKLLSMKNHFVESDCLEDTCDDYVEEITDEEYYKNVNEIDNLIRDIIRTKQKLRLGKLKSKIKTKQDFYNFMRIRDSDNNSIPPEPTCPGQSQYYLNNFKIDQNSKVNNDYNLIREKLKVQEENFKKTNKNAKDKTFITGELFSHNDENQNTNNDDDLNSIFEEIKKAESRFDDLLGDIDDCIKLGEDIDKIIDLANDK